jgi:hypothetical protein
LVSPLKCEMLIPQSSKEHQSTDWSGIHVKICQALIPLRVPSKVLGSEEERARREKNVKKNQVIVNPEFRLLS